MKALLQVWNECEQEKSKEIDDPYRYYKDKIGGLYRRFGALRWWGFNAQMFN
jgi:hypothetical protein